MFVCGLSGSSSPFQVAEIPQSHTLFLRNVLAIANQFGRKDPLLPRATSSKIEQKQQAQLMKTNPVGAADRAHVAEKKGGVAVICEEKDTFKRFMWSTGNAATVIHICLCLPRAMLSPPSSSLAVALDDDNAVALDDAVPSR
jgi:hypothetical protein